MYYLRPVLDGAAAMKLALVSPQFPFSGRVPLVPPILEYLAALTGREAPEIGMQLVDANQSTIRAEDITSDAVAISVMTATAPWAYRFADDCRKRGVRVILGGIHPTALPDEAALHADAVVTGEAESVWGRVLSDMQAGSLSKVYHGERMPLNNLPMPVDGKLKGNYQFRAFFTMRGCPHRCTFCSVRKFFGDTIRYRPIPEVVNEVEARAGKLWFNGDDNIWGGNIQRSIDLFDEFAQGTKRHWYGFGDLRSIQGSNGARLLAAARQSGLFSVWTGWESDEAHLGSFNARGKQGADRVAAVKQMQDAGIDVTLFVVLGGRQESIDSFKKTLELSERLQVGIHPVLLTPLPGTELYDEYRDYLLPDLGWEAYTGVRAVFEHPSADMSPLRREQEYHRLSHELFRFERIVSRIGKISSHGFPSTHLYSFMMQVPMKHALSKAYEEWKAERAEALSEPENAALPETVVAADAVTGHGLKDNAVEAALPARAGFWYWLPFIIAITVVDIIEMNFMEFSSYLNMLEGVLFSSSFVVVLGNLFARRKRLYRAFDLLIDWSRDGRSRKALMLRQAATSVIYLGAQYWAFTCVFNH